MDYSLQEIGLCAVCGEQIKRITADRPGLLALLSLPDWAHASGSKGHAGRPENESNAPAS